jgi:hypothetical protein
MVDLLSLVIGLSSFVPSVSTWPLDGVFQAAPQDAQQFGKVAVVFAGRIGQGVESRHRAADAHQPEFDEGPDRFRVAVQDILDEGIGAQWF